MDGQDVNCFHTYLGYTALQAACAATSHDTAGQLSLVKILLNAKVLCSLGTTTHENTHAYTDMHTTPLFPNTRTHQLRGQH